MKNELKAIQGNNTTEIFKYISDMLKNGRFQHAMLFETADDYLADLICKYAAKAALCTSDEKRPCGECISCRKVESGIHPDVFTAEGTGARTLHVEDIRNIRQDAYIAPNEGERKVYIIKNAGDMSQQSQNALLKVLEEPPEYVVFILTCKSRSELLDTVLSRVQIFNVNSDGGNTSGNESEADAEIFNGIINSMIDRDEYALLAKCSLIRTRKQAENAVKYLYDVFSSALMMKYGGHGSKICGEITSAFSAEKVRDICRCLEKASELIATNVNNTLFSVYLPAKLTDTALR